MEKLLNFLNNKKCITGETDNMISLPRGGYLVETSEGHLQFGSPPETIKDTMLLPGGTPSVFILPYDHFDPGTGMSLAEIEFPTYFNFFINKKKIEVYVHPQHVEKLYKVFREAFLGPETVDISSEYDKTEGLPVPELMAEMKYFRSGLNIEDLLDIKPIDEKGIKRGKVEVFPVKGGGFKVFESGKLLAEVPSEIKPQVHYDLGKTLNEPFIPPDFGITCLGPSHGFDPKQNTSGFILWVGKVGIMVDPPVNITSWLKDSNVNPKLIDSVILTHCHSDHDAGTFQKILEETKIKIYTTPTIMKSFLAKYSELTRIPERTLMGMFDFSPVKLDTEYDIHGGFFNFFYSIHSIPTIGFYFLYRDKTFLYSSDHQADPEKLKEMHEKGVISKERLDFFLHVPWEMDIIYHEAGIPPLHTPVSFLNTLPKELQKKITVYHIAEKDFPEKTDLKLARFGIGNTYYPEIEKHKLEEAYRILDVFSRIDLFSELPFRKSKNLLLNVKEEKFLRGEYIIRKDTPGDKFYVIVSGNVEIGGLDSVEDKVYGTYEYFGEASLVLGTPRKADVIAATNVTAYSIEKKAFLRLINDTPVEKLIRRIAETRSGATWKIIKKNKYLKELSSSQITQLELLLDHTHIKGERVIIRRGEKINNIYILIDGNVEKNLDGDNWIKCESGELLGDISGLHKAGPSQIEYRVRGGAELYRIRAKDFSSFLNDNPGLLMSILFNYR